MGNYLPNSLTVPLSQEILMLLSVHMLHFFSKLRDDIKEIKVKTDCFSLELVFFFFWSRKQKPFPDEKLVEFSQNQSDLDIDHDFVLIMDVNHMIKNSK